MIEPSLLVDPAGCVSLAEPVSRRDRSSQPGSSPPPPSGAAGKPLAVAPGGGIRTRWAWATTCSRRWPVSVENIYCARAL